MLSPFDKRILRMMHLLTQHNKLMSSLEISRRLTESGMLVTDRTVRRWFEFLYKHRFQYFAHLRYESIGLNLALVLHDHNDKLLDKIPYKMGIARVIDHYKSKNHLLAFYASPFARFVGTINPAMNYCGYIRLSDIFRASTRRWMARNLVPVLLMTQKPSFRD